MKFLRNRITVYVPEGVARVVHNHIKELADAAGGATHTQATGYWHGEEEPVIVVTVFYEQEAYTRVQNALDNLLAAMGRNGQVEVLVDHTPAQAGLV